MTNEFEAQVKESLVGVITRAKNDERYILGKLLINKKYADYYRELVLKTINSYRIYRRDFDAITLLFSRELARFNANKKDNTASVDDLNFSLDYREDGTPIGKVSFKYEQKNGRREIPSFQAEESYNEEIVAQLLAPDEITVKKDEIGLTLSIENIQFKPDSAYLLDSEKEKLKKIVQILEAYPEKDILVSGHTALAGSLESCQKLSELRAQAVAGQLISMGARDSKHIFTKGYGASKPIGSNSTAEGKAKNRRVEITLMDK